MEDQQIIRVIDHGPRIMVTKHPEQRRGEKWSRKSVKESKKEADIQQNGDADCGQHKAVRQRSIEDTEACRNYADGLTKALDERLAKEAAAPATKP